MEAGKYNAFIVDYGVNETKNGFTRVWAKFTNEANDSVFWNGVIKEGMAEQITMATLDTMGFNGSFEDLNGGHMTEALDIRKKFEIVVEDNTWEGKTTQRIKFVNDPSKGGAERMPPEKVHIKKAYFENAWKTAQAAKKAKTTLPPQTAQTEKAAGGDIPF